MPASPPPPDRFQREIDDIVRLAEKRLERQSMGSRAQRGARSFRGAMRGLNIRVPRLPRVDTMAGWAMALLLLGVLVGLFGPGSLAFWLQVVGMALLVTALVVSLITGGGRTGGDKYWRGERIRYSSPYGAGGLLARLRRLLRGR